MKGRFYLSLAAATLIFAACSVEEDSCDDLTGTITHTTTQITGIESVDVLRRNPINNIDSAIDQTNGTEFSNLSINLNLSWIDEQHRFRQSNTFIQSALNWFIAPSMACSLAPYYEDYQPSVTNISIYSGSDFSDAYTAGSDLSIIFNVQAMNASMPLNSSADTLLSAKQYNISAAWLNNELVATPTTPQTHSFTILLELDDGQQFEVQTPNVLISAN